MQLTLSLLRSNISDPGPIINSKVGDKDGGEVVVAAETGKNNLFSKFLYSEKVRKFCKIFTFLLTGTT